MRKLFLHVFFLNAQLAVIAILIFPLTLLYLVLYTLLAFGIITQYIGRPEPASFSRFRRGRMYEVDKPPTDEKKDFRKHRSYTYFNQMIFGSLWEFSKLVGNRQRIPLIEDHVMYDVLMNTGFSYGLIRGDENSDIIWRLPIEMSTYRIFKGYFWDLRELRIHRDKHISLVDKTGKIHTPSSPTWPLAKAHAQSQLSFYAPGFAHNHVHFVFPSLMASHVRSVLPPTSVLRQLLEPHTRFTQYINNKALMEGQSSSNTGSLTDRLFRPWLSFPIDNDDFIGGIQQHCEEFYYDQLRLYRDLQDDLPYQAFLKKYYGVIRNFVAKLEPLLTDDYEDLSSSVSPYLPAVKRHSMCDVIATLIWNCGLVHYCDHHGYLDHFAWKYGCMSIRKPLISHGSNTNGRKPMKEVSKVATDEASDFFHAEDVYRTRCFLRTFVLYSPSWGLDLKLANTRYQFTQPEALAAAADFLHEMRLLDLKLTRNRENLQPLSNIIRTICF